MAFAGYLIKLGGSEGTELPLVYLRAESYSAVTKQAENINRRVVTGKLYRKTAEHQYAEVSVQSRALNNTNLAALNALIAGAMSDTVNRDITIEFYDPETDTYKEADCYMPETPFVIRKVEDENTVTFQPVTYTFIEY